MTDMQQQGYLKYRMIPTKGKGWMVTAANIAVGEPEELSRPLTTDPWDNAMLIEYGKDTTDA